MKLIPTRTMLLRLTTCCSETRQALLTLTRDQAEPGQQIRVTGQTVTRARQTADRVVLLIDI